MNRNKRIKKGIAAATSAAMLMGTTLFSTPAVFAADTQVSSAVSQTEQETTQLAAAATTGKWGTCDWNFSDGILTIGGGYVSDAIAILSLDYKEQVKEVKITDKIKCQKNTSLSYLFNGYTNLEKITGMENVDTTNVVAMSNMFNNCEKLQSVDVSGFNTDAVTNMKYMFFNCKNLTTIDVSRFNTKNVTDMSYIFYDCKSLKLLDLSKWDTTNVTDMSFAFSGCQSLTTLNVSGFKTGKVKNMYGMFQLCKKVKSIDVGGWDTSNVTNMSWMFSNCVADALDVSKWNTSKVTDMSYMFANCVNVKKLDVNKFDTSNVKDMSYMFSWCDNLEELNVGNFNTSKATNIAGMFSGCAKVRNLSVGQFNTVNVTNMSSLFNECRSISALDVSRFNTSKVTNMSYMFSGCEKVNKLDVGKFDTSNVTNMSGMFNRCNSVKALDVSRFNTSKVTNMGTMFSSCEQISSLDVSKFDTGNVIDMYYMFCNCTNLKELDLGNFGLGKIVCGNYKGVEDIIFGTNLNKIKMPKNLGNDEVKSRFNETVLKYMSDSDWKDATANINYTGKPDTLTAGHTYMTYEKQPGADINVSLSSNVSNTTLGTDITLTAKAEGTSGTYTYRFMAYDSAANQWKVIKDFSSASTCTWNADAIGSKKFYVEVKDSKGNITKSRETQVSVGVEKNVIPNGSYVLKNGANNRYALDVFAGSTGNGANIQLYEANGTAAQTWTVTNDSNGYITITNTNSGKALDMWAGSTAVGTNIQQYESNGSNAQKWIPLKQSDGSVKLVSVLDQSVCICLNGSTAANSVNVQMGKTKADKSQNWTFEKSKQPDDIALENKDTLADGVYTIKSAVNPSYVFDVWAGSTDNSANVQLYEANETEAQVWKISHDSKGYVTITNTKSGKALDVWAGSTANGANIQQYTSNGSKAQKWIAIKEADGSIKLMSALDKNICIDLNGGSAANGANIQIYASNDTKAQRWIFEKYKQLDDIALENKAAVADGTYTIASAVDSSYVFDVAGGSAANGANVQVYKSNGTGAQIWKISHDSKGYITIINKNSGKALDVFAGSTANGANIQQYESNGSKAQKWIAVKNADGSVKLISALDKNICIDLNGGAASNSQNVQIYRSNDTKAQRWVFKKM